MTPKKSKKADLEGKRILFFLFGIALTLLGAIIVIQYENEVSITTLHPNTPTDVVSIDIPITRTDIEKKEPKPLEKPKIFIKDLPPEEGPDVVKLNISKIYDDGKEEEGVKDIPFEGGDIDKVETVDFVVLSNIARPMECADLHNMEAQKACFNDWIQRFISENTHYPEMARQMHLEDKVYITFVISEMGNVENVAVAKGKYDLLNDEAVRVLKTMPQMTPGKQYGKPVKMRMTVPVNFKLSGQ